MVSPIILESNNILEKQQAKDFNLSKIFKKNAYLYQRITEFNYPIRMNENSKMFFFLNKENVPDNCKILETGKYLKFTQC